jgi:hypothetical protein
MKFDVVIGNPPYQDSDGSGLNGGSALYDKFMQMASTISDINSMIVPMRYLTQYNVKGIDKQWVDSELHGNKYRKIVYCRQGNKVFKNTRIKGGIMYFLKDEEYKGMCSVEEMFEGETNERYLAKSDDMDIMLFNTIESNIVDKIYSVESFSNYISNTSPFGIESNASVSGTGLKLYRSFGNIEDCGLCCITRGHEYINKYKAMIVRHWGEGLRGERPPKAVLLTPGEVCTGSFILVASNESKEYCQNVIKFMQTKFVAMAVGLRKSTHNATKDAYKFIPMQEFDNTQSDINWNESIENIDRQLFKKYKLDEKEIDYIVKEYVG